jgi:MFS family permease
MALPAPAQNERNVLILTGVGHFSTHFFELMFPTLAVSLAAQHHAPLDEVLGWSFLGYLLFGLGALPAGLLADRINTRRLLVVAMFGLGVAALAASEAETPRALSICLAAMGLCASVYHPVGMSLISRTIAARGRALGVNGICGNLAIAMTPVVTAALAARMGWQGAFRMAGYVMCSLAVTCAFLRVSEPERSVRPPAAPRPLGRSDAAVFVLLLVAAALAGIAYRGNTLVQPAYFAAHVPELTYGVATSLAYLLGIAGQYLGGQLADRYELRRLYVLFHALSVPALLAMAVLTGLPLVGAAALYLFFGLGMQPIENSLFAHYTPERWRATAYGLKFVCTFGIGSLAVWLVRWADRLGGLSYAVVCLAGVVALVAVAALAVLRLTERSAPRQRRSVAAALAPTALLVSNPAPTERRPPR